ncbi:sterol desaturase family protein [Cuniculiplasma sp. SKW3]|uniref:sterol desaturase family protein n=1 Tax=Cuniculiplasma sp. SKW3 TaxID=3400170 RepID=UPI003FD2C666
MDYTVILTGVGIMIASAILMEGVAWALHKYVMHGVGWFLHESHHRPPGTKKGILEKNDAYSIGFAIIAIILIYFGFRNLSMPYFWIGVGMTLYGAGYAIFHDIIFHQRIKVKRPQFSKYLNRIIAAHEIHHRYSSGKKGYSFGFLYAPKFYSRPNIVKDFPKYIKDKEQTKRGGSN